MQTKPSIGPCESRSEASRRIGVFLASKFDRTTAQDNVAAGLKSQLEFVALHEQQGFDLVGLSHPLDLEGRAVHRRFAAKLLHPSSMIELRRLLSTYDALIMMGEDIGVPLALSLPARMSKANMFIVCHGTFFNSAIFRQAAKFLRSFDKVYMLAISESIRLQLIHDFGFPWWRCYNVGHPVDTDFYAPVTGSDQGIVVSAGVVNRDYPTLFAAVEPLNVTVKIAVNSSWGASASVEARPPGNVVLCEPPLGYGLRDLYRQARIVVIPLHPVRYACGYSSIFEAMAVGKPVITTQMVGQSEIIVDGETGFLVSPSDSDQLRDRINLLIQQPELAQRMGEAARRQVVKLASLPNYTANFASIVHSNLQSLLVARTLP